MKKEVTAVVAAKRSAKKHPVHHISVEPAQNGHVVHTHFRPKDAKPDSPGYYGMPEPQQHVFAGPDAADQVGAHIAETLKNSTPQSMADDQSATTPTPSSY